MKKQSSVTVKSLCPDTGEKYDPEIFQIFEIDRCINTASGMKFVFDRFAYRVKDGDGYLWVDVS